jgi:hypothetical protein
LYLTTLSVGVNNQIPKCFNFKHLKQSATINVYDLPPQRHHLVILRKIANTLMADGMTFYFSLCRISHLATAEKVNLRVSSLTLNWGYKRDNFDTKSKNIQKVSSFYFFKFLYKVREHRWRLQSPSSYVCRQGRRVINQPGPYNTADSRQPKRNSNL